MSFPLPPSPSINWANMDLTKPQIGRGHIEATYSAITGEWSAPRWVTSPILNINGLASCLHYGQQVFEGLRAWRAPNGQINVFRPKDNARRMRQSAAAVAMPPPSEELFLECVRLAIVGNSDLVPPHGNPASLYIRPFMLGTGPQMAPVPPHEYTLYVFVGPVYPYLGNKAVDAIVLDEFDRAAPKGVGAVKLGGNYAPVIKWTEQAKKDGFGMTLHLDSLTHSEIDEFSTSAFMGVYINEEVVRTLVVTDSQNAIESFTADSCISLAKKVGWKVEKRRIPYTELGRFVEVIAAGSAASLVPINSISRTSTGDKFEYGDKTASEIVNSAHGGLSRMLLEIQQGIAEDIFGWRYKLEAKNDEELRK